MTDKAVISSYTYRTLDSQDEYFRVNFPDASIFVLPDDLDQLFRPTTRKCRDALHVVSLGVIAEDEKHFRDFLALARKSKAKLVSQEDGNFWIVPSNIENLVKWWKDARRKGSAKIGGERGGAAKKAAVEERAKAFTKAEWVDGSIKNAQLVEKYDMSINTLRRIASDRGWGHDRQRAIWRAEAATKKKPLTKQESQDLHSHIWGKKK